MISKFLSLLILAFIYSNTLQLGATYLVFSMIAIASVWLVLTKRVSFDKRMIVFLSVYFIILLLIFLYSFALNPFTDVIGFLAPYGIFLMLPSIYYVVNIYGIEKYFHHMSISYLVLIIYFVYVIYLFVAHGFDQVNNLALLQNNLMVTYYREIGDIRVTLKTFIFTVPLMLYVIIFYQKIAVKILLFLILIYLQYKSKTYGLLISSFGVLFLLYFITSNLIKRIIAIILLGSALFLVVNNLESILELESFRYKLYSIELKITQIISSIEVLNNSILFGHGFGYEIPPLDDRGDYGLVVEVYPVMLLILNGVIGMFGVLFLHLSIPIWLLIKYKYSKDKNALFLALSQISIVLASFFNPYIWSGGVGLFFIVFGVAYLSCLNITQKNYVT
jgi:hypothetical protein